MYKSPIDLIYDRVVTEQENEVFKAVVRCGIDVDKDELIKALAYDRRQYDLGYADGKMDANAELIRCKDCKYYEVAELNYDGTPDKRCKPSVCTNGKYAVERPEDWYCGDAEPKEEYEKEEGKGSD